MFMNAFWVFLYIALLAGVGGGAYYLGNERGEDRGKEEASLTAEEASYFDQSVATLVRLGYVWDGEAWTEQRQASTNSAPIATPEADRTNCGEIQGTAYRSPSERTFYLSTCLSQAAPSSPDCGVPANPWCFDLVPGEVIQIPPAEFCDYFKCSENFWAGTGYVVRCQDETFSKTGGTSDACSDFGGVAQPLYSH